MNHIGFGQSGFALKATGFTSKVNPDDAILALFTGGKQGVWYDPSDKSTLFQDVAGTVPVTKDGDPVALMKDKSGNDNHAVQTVSTKRPVYKTYGILHWLNFDGVDDYFESNNLVPYDGNSLYIATALKTNNLSTGGVFRFKDNNVDGNEITANYLEEFISTGKLLVQRRPSTMIISDRDQQYPKSACVSWVSNGTTIKHQIIPNNSILDIGYTKLTSGVAEFGLGVGYKGQKLSGNIYGSIWVSDAVSDGDRVTANEYLAKKSGVTL